MVEMPDCYIFRYMLYCQSVKIKGNDFVWNISWSHDTVNSDGFPYKKINGKFAFLDYPLPSSLTYEDTAVPQNALVRKFKGNHNRTAVKPVNCFETYIANTVYDLMELVAIKYTEGFFSKEMPQYPLFCYNDETVKECIEFKLFTSHMSERPKPLIPEISNMEFWHRSFAPKQYWTCI